MKLHQGRPTVAEIDRGALRRNLAEVRRALRPETRLLAVVKADAYGHGAGEVARVLEAEGVRAFGVATVEEGVALRQAGVVDPEVLVLAGLVAEQVEALLEHHLTPVVGDLETARLLDRSLRGALRALPVHVKVDTGLGRIGATLGDLPDLLDAVRKLERVKAIGVLSHLGSAAHLDTPAIEAQVASFRRAVELAALHGCPAQVRSLANSLATLTRPDLHFDLVRPGIVLYGVAPGGAPPPGVRLRPAMKLATRILQLRTLPAGHGVSYDQTFVCARETRVATLPIGYADGYPRALSNRAAVLVGGRRAPVIGRVCMDLTMVDVTDVPGVAAGDPVVLWGTQGSAEIAVDEVAAWAGTIPYEILTTVGRRVPRVYVN